MHDFNDLTKLQFLTELITYLFIGKSFPIRLAWEVLFTRRNWKLFCSWFQIVNGTQNDALRHYLLFTKWAFRCGQLGVIFDTFRWHSSKLSLPPKKKLVEKKVQDFFFFLKLQSFNPSNTIFYWSSQTFALMRCSFSVNWICFNDKLYLWRSVWIYTLQLGTYDWFLFFFKILRNIKIFVSAVLHVNQ